MGELWDAFLSIPKRIIDVGKWIRKGDIIAGMKIARTETALKRQYNKLSEEDRNDPAVLALYENKLEGVKQDKEKGMFGALPDVLYDGFTDLKDTMSDAAGAAIAVSYSTLFKTFTGRDLSKKAKEDLSGTNVPKAIEGIVDSILDVGFMPFEKGIEALDPEILEERKEGIERAKTAVKEVIRLSAGLGGVIGLQGYIMEHFHPTKHTAASRALNMIIEMLGFRRLRDAYLGPLRENLIELPLQYKWNSLIQAKLPTEGEITGLARKYEITAKQYEDAMKKQGIGTFWIEKLLQGFWADPRLFEIIRLMEVERPPTTVDPKGAKWLKQAGLDKYIGPDWWLAMKFGKAGYDEIDIPVLISAVKARNVQRELGDIRTMNRDLYKRGVYTRAQFEAILTERGVSMVEGKEMMDAIDTAVKQTNNREIQRAYERKYKYGRITKEELEKKFEEFGLHEDYIKGRMEYLFTMKEGKLAAEGDEKELTRAQIVNAYKYGQKEKGWCLKEIDDMGYSTEDALMLTESVDQDVKNDTVKEWIRVYETKTLNGRMTIEELQGKYVERGKTEEWAEARAAYMEERVLGKEEVSE